MNHFPFSIPKKKSVRLINLCATQSLIRFCIVNILLIGCLLSLTFPALSQGQQLQESLKSYLQQPTTQLDNLEIASVYLDGRPLFALTAGSLTDNTEETKVSPIQERIKTVRRQLDAIAQKRLTPENLAVTSKLLPIDDDTLSSSENREQLAIIEVNQQYLLTINATDAGIYGKNVTTHALDLAEIINAALIRHYEERQSPYLQKYGLLSMGIIIVAFTSTFLLRLFQHQLKQQRSNALNYQNAKQPIQIPEILPETDHEYALQIAHEQKEFQNRLDRIKFRYDFGKTGLQLLLVGLWIGSLLLILSYFPQTRWIASFAFAGVLRKLCQIALCLLGTYILIRFSFLCTNYGFSLLRRGQLISHNPSVRSLLRLQTLSGYVKSVCVFILTLGGLLLVLSILGLDLAPILAGAGILGLAISFGSQNLIKDVINGLFVIWEDQFGVGDVITINAVTGSVETMNLRITQLRSQDGDLITIPNGKIEIVKNHSNQWSRVNLGIEVAYDTDLDHGIEVIRQTASMMRWDPIWRDSILEEPEVLGVDDFGDNSITIRLWIKTVPLKQWAVSREFRRRLKFAFDQADISIPFPQRSIWFENSLPER